MYEESKYQTCLDFTPFTHFLEDHDLICSLPQSKLSNEISKDYTLKEIKELANDHSLKICFNCKSNIQNH